MREWGEKIVPHICPNVNDGEADVSQGWYSGLVPLFATDRILIPFLPSTDSGTSAPTKCEHMLHLLLFG